MGSYVWDRDHLVETEPVQIVPGKELAARLQEGDQPAILMGECHRVSGTEACDRVTLAPESARLPRGSSVAILGAARTCPAGISTAISAWTPSTSAGQKRRNYGKRDIRKDGKAPCPGRSVLAAAPGCRVFCGSLDGRHLGG